MSADENASSSADAEAIRAVRGATANNDSVFYAHRVFAEVSQLLRTWAPRDPRSILEIGPGANLGPLACFAMSGVARCASLDVARLESPNVHFYEQLVDLVEAVDGFRWWRPFSDQEFPGVEFPSRRTRPDPAALAARIERRTWSPGPKVDEPDGAFDAVYSVATFEHLDDPRGVLREATRVLAADGVMVHEIDLTHHSSPEPLRFLTWEEEEWLQKAGKYGDEVTLRRILDGEWKGEVYCNRLRVDDWLALFRESGLEVMMLEPIITLSRESIPRESFVAPFREKSLDDLAVLAFRAVLRRG